MMQKKNALTKPNCLLSPPHLPPPHTHTHADINQHKCNLHIHGIYPVTVLSQIKRAPGITPGSLSVPGCSQEGAAPLWDSSGVRRARQPPASPPLPASPGRGGWRGKRSAEQQPCPTALLSCPKPPSAWGQSPDPAVSHPAQHISSGFSPVPPFPVSPQPSCAAGTDLGPPPPRLSAT